MRLYRPTRPPVNAQSAQKGSPSMGAGMKRLRGGPFRPYRTHHPWLPLQGPIPPIRGKCPEGTKGVGMLAAEGRLRGCIKFAATSPSRLRRATSPGRGGLGSAHPKASPMRGRLGCRQPCKKVQTKFVGLHLFCGLIFTHSIAIAVVFGSCFGALFGIESCRMPFSNFARISFGSRPSPT